MRAQGGGKWCVNTRGGKWAVLENGWKGGRPLVKEDTGDGGEVYDIRK